MQKYLKILTILIAAFVPAFAFADTSSTIALPSGFIASMWSNAQSIFTGFGDLTNTILGVLLALLVIGELIHMLRKPN